MLRFVEAVNLVQEEDDGVGSFVSFRLAEKVKLAALVSVELLDRLDDFAQLCFARRDGRQVVEGFLGDGGDHARQRGFADAGRSPEDHAGHGALLQGALQGFAGADQVGLTDKAR